MAAYNDIACPCPGMALNINKSIFVDSVYGTTNGIRGDLTRPFSTIAAAVSVAQPQDVIFVHPGAYQNETVLITGVKLYFQPSTVVSGCTFTGVMTIMGDAEFVDCQFAGEGVIEGTSFSSTLAAPIFTTDNDTFIRAKLILASGGGVAILSNAGTAYVKVDVINNPSTQVAQGHCHIECEVVNTTAAIGFIGEIVLNAKIIEYLGPGTLFSVGDMRITAEEIFSFDAVINSSSQTSISAKRIDVRSNSSTPVFVAQPGSRISIFATQIVYEVVDTLFLSQGTLNVNAIVEPATVPQTIANLISADGTATFNCSRASFIGPITATGLFYINSENLTIDAPTTISSGYVSIAAATLSLSGNTITQTGGTLYMNVGYSIGQTATMLNASAGSFYVLVNRLQTQTVVIAASGTAIGSLGGQWTTLGPNLITVVDTPRLTILPSKFISGSAFITCAAPTDVYVMPSISNQSGILANFVPAGALLVNAGIM